MDVAQSYVGISESIGVARPEQLRDLMLRHRRGLECFLVSGIGACTHPVCVIGRDVLDALERREAPRRGYVRAFFDGIVTRDLDDYPVPGCWCEAGRNPSYVRGHSLLCLDTKALVG